MASHRHSRPSPWQLWLLLLLSALVGATAAEAHYAATVDLRERADDRFHVSLTVPAVAREGAVGFQLPAYAPGTYQVHDWGRLLVSIEARAADGTALTVTRADTNRWTIAEGDRLHRIDYVMEDSLDADLGSTPIYPMAATSLAEDHCFVNPFGLFGYLTGETDLSYRTSYRLPADWRAASALVAEQEADRWTLVAPDYQTLADCPVLFGDLAQRSLTVDGCEVLIAAWSPAALRDAWSLDQLSDHVAPVVTATRDFIGHLPAERYAFLFYLTPPRLMAGALEHRTSSFYYMPALFIDRMLPGIAAHEFFHIITPLNIREHRIDRFDFADPVAPRHLWFYEGATEYASVLLRRRSRLIDTDAFLANLREKFATARGYRQDIAFTTMSEGVLGEHRGQYMNVYHGGALLALAVDLECRRLTDNQVGLREIFRRLVERFGPERSFASEDFFTILAEVGHADLQPFLERHIGGTEPVPYADLLAQAGIFFRPQGTERRVTSIPMLRGNRAGIVVHDPPPADSPFRQGDRVLQIGELTIGLRTIPELKELLRGGLPEGDTVTVRVERRQPAVEGEEPAPSEEIAIPVEVVYGEVPSQRIELREMTEISPAQQAFRRQWLGPPVDELAAPEPAPTP